MKKIYRLLTFVLLSTITVNLYSQSLIHSTPAGGNWNDANTWVEQIIPGSNDTVVICGTVTISSSPVSCHDLRINEACTLQNSGGLKILNVGGSVSNNGSLTNPSTQLNVYINGNIENNGIWRLNLTQLIGSGDQTISCDTGSYFECVDFKSIKPSGNVVAGSNLVFLNSKTDFGQNMLIMAEGLRLTINGQYLRNINIASAGFFLDMGQNAFMQGVTASNATTGGTLLTGSSTNLLTGTVTNNGIIGNYGTSHDLIIEGSLVNNSSILNASSNLTICLSGNLENNGEIENYKITLTGTSDQHISSADSTLIGCEYLLKTGSGMLLFDTDVTLCDCAVDLGNSTVVMSQGTALSVTFESAAFRYFRSAVVNANNGMIYMNNGGYLNDVTLMNASLAGTIQIGDHDCVFTGTTTILGTLQNYGTSNHILNINGDIVNNGSIVNGTGLLEINVTGNVTNNFIWENYKLNLIGTTEQQITQASDVFFNIPIVNAQNTFSYTDLTFNNAQLSFGNHNLVMQPGKTLTVSGSTGYLKQINLFANQCRLALEGGAYLTAANLHDAELSEQIILRASDVNFYGATVVSGTIENQGINHYTFCYGSIFNSGSVTNGESQLTVHIQQNITNDGSWSNYQTVLDGNSDQFIYLHDDVEIAGTVLLDSKGSSPWQWYMDGVILTGYNGRYLTFNGVSPADYGLYSCTTGSGISREFVVCRASEADFISDIVSGCHPLSVQFTDQSFSHFGITSWLWDFGDGYTSDEQNPEHIYDIPGIYLVSLTVSDAFNTTSTFKDEFISVYQTPVADFDFSNVTIGEAVQFIDRSSEIQRQVIYQTLWADTVIAFSSRYTSPEIPEWWWSEEQALGEPDVYPNYGDSVKAWAPLTANRQREFIELGYDSAMKVSRVTIYETMKPGTVDTLYVRNPEGDWIIVWTGTASPQPDSARAFQIDFPLTEFAVSEIRIAMNSPAIPYWNEIDAVSVSGPIDTIINPLTQYYWDMDDGSHYFTAGDISHIYDLPGKYDVTLTLTNPEGCSDIITKTVTVYDSGLIPVNIRAYLHGPFSGSEMNTGLNAAGVLPLSQPYNELPWNYPGEESVASIPDADIVDWALVELRKSSGGPETATSDSIISRMAGFIRQDGFITGTDGNTPLMADIIDTANIYPVVIHRNHLSVISSVSVNKENGRIEYDFTSGDGQSWGLQSQTHMGVDLFGMWSGDADSDGQIEAGDIFIWKNQAGKSGYFSSDVNLSGDVQNQDKNDFILIHQGKVSHVPD